MDRFGIQLNLEHVAQAREKWAMAYAKFASEVDYMMSRLLNEAAINRLSVEQVARWSGMKPSRVRRLMRDNNLNPKQSKTLLAQTAAEALQENAALLGIEPWEMDLMSPLAYLPMGSELREQLEQAEVSGNVEVTQEMVETFKAAWHKADEQGREGQRVVAGLRAVLELIQS